MGAFAAHRSAADIGKAILEGSICCNALYGIGYRIELFFLGLFGIVLLWCFVHPNLVN